MEQRERTHYEKKAIASYMVDGKRQLTPTLMFNLMQEVAVNHADLLGVGWNFLHKVNQFWALSRMDVEILRMPEWQEQVEIFTWPKKANFLVQPRDYQIETLDGEVLVRSTSNWVILDDNGKPQQLSAYEDNLGIQEGLHSIEAPASRLRTGVPCENPVFKPVVYSNIDMNRHANNSAYVTWVMDSFDNEFHDTHRLSFLAINYLQQTHADDRYAVMKQETAPDDFLCSVYSEKNMVEVCRVRTVWK
ncbi:MAG: hypothetical protein K5846_07845 [Bacteroidales bacterium]|nr:hypothetical protein [Bacteroidales bacterium]